MFFYENQLLYKNITELIIFKHNNLFIMCTLHSDNDCSIMSCAAVSWHSQILVVTFFQGLIHSVILTFLFTLCIRQICDIR